MIELMSDISYRYGHESYDCIEARVKDQLAHEGSDSQLLMGSFINRLSLYLHYFVEHLDPQYFRLVQFLFITKDIPYHFDVLSCVTPGCDHKDECLCHVKLRGRDDLSPYIGLVDYHSLDSAIGRLITELSTRFDLLGSKILVRQRGKVNFDFQFSQHKPIICFSSYFDAFRNEENRVERILPSMLAFSTNTCASKSKQKGKRKKGRDRIGGGEEGMKDGDWGERTFTSQINSSVSYTQPCVPVQERIIPNVVDFQRAYGGSRNAHVLPHMRSKFSGSQQ